MNWYRQMMDQYKKLPACDHNGAPTNGEVMRWGAFGVYPEDRHKCEDTEELFNRTKNYYSPLSDEGRAELRKMLMQKDKSTK